MRMCLLPSCGRVGTQKLAKRNISAFCYSDSCTPICSEAEWRTRGKRVWRIEGGASGPLYSNTHAALGSVCQCKYVCEVIYCTWDSHNLLGQSQEICLRGHILSIPLISEKSRDMTNKAGYGHSIYHIGV